MRTYFIFFIFVIMLFNGVAIEALQAQKLPELIPFRKGDKWGYADSNKNIIIPPIYTSVDFFIDGAGVVSTSKGEGLIDKRGDFIIPPGGDNLDYEGGNWILAYRSTDKINNFLFGLYNKKGKLVIPIKYNGLSIPKEGLCRYTIEEDGFEKYGIIDTNGRIMVKPKYMSVNDFKEGLAVVKKFGNK